MKNLTFKEHLFLVEARKPDVRYSEKQIKGVLDRVTATLKGNDSASMTKMAKRYARLEASMKAMKEKRDELNETLKTNVNDLFNAEDIVLTRVVETAQFTLTMSKETMKKDSTEVDYSAIIAGLSALIASDLQPRVDEIIEKYTRVIPGGKNAARLSVSKEVNEDVSSIVNKVKSLAASLFKSLTSWASKYDTKLEALKAKAGVK